MKFTAASIASGHPPCIEIYYESPAEVSYQEKHDLLLMLLMKTFKYKFNSTRPKNHDLGLIWEHKVKLGESNLGTLIVLIMHDVSKNYISFQLVPLRDAKIQFPSLGEVSMKLNNAIPKFKI